MKPATTSVRFTPWFVLALASCQSGGYSGGMTEVHTHLREGRLEDARTHLDIAIAEKPRESTLLLLERALIHQQRGDFESSRADFYLADEDFEVIDFSGEPGDDFALLMARPSMANYRGTPYEKILLNTLNIINHLALSDLEEGRVEARRAMVMHESVVDYERQNEFENPLTELLYGLLFEASERPNDAHLAYKNVYEAIGADFLRARLVACADEIGHSDLRRWKQEFGDLPDAVPAGHGTIVVVVMNGAAPVREATVTPDRKIRYARLVAKERAFSAARVSVAGGPRQDLVNALDVEGQALSYFDDVESKTLAGARLKDMHSGGGSRMYNIADTRSWNLLPAEVWVGVLAVPEGSHEIELQLEGGRDPAPIVRQVEVGANEFEVVQVFVRT